MGITLYYNDIQQYVKINLYLYSALKKLGLLGIGNV